MARVARSGITGSFDRAKLEDLFIGRHRDTDFRMVEARLKKRRRGRRKKGQKTVFSGLLCEIGVPLPFAGVVLVVGDKGALGNWIVDWLRDTFEGIASWWILEGIIPVKTETLRRATDATTRTPRRT